MRLSVVKTPDYSSTLAYLYERLPMFHRIGKAAYKADLDNTHALMRMLGHPERGLKCVHIAGTNGKGSTCHMIASVLQEAGYTTGLYTSPHLKDFRERIRVNGIMIPKLEVTDFVQEHQEAFDRIAPSFFEWTVALAFDHFRKEKTEIAVIETGLGGRLDSTNVVTPEVSIITNIGWDHADLLGASLELIAGEKAGIIKAGVPVVVGRAAGSVADVFRKKAQEVDTPIAIVDHDTPLSFTLDLAGEYQQDNARTALAAIHQLRAMGWKIPDEAIVRGLSNVVRNTGLRGRWETIAHDPLTIVDVGHNEAGLRAVREQLDRTSHKQLHIVIGTVNDKDIDRMLAQLPVAAGYYFCKADLPRGLDANELARRARRSGLKGMVHPSVATALQAARSAAAKEDLVLVTGSVFVVAEVL